MSLRSRFYLPGANAGLWRGLGRRLSGRPVPRFPRTVQIQTITGCNADCFFCPYGSTQAHQPRGRMPAKLFRALIDECARYPVRRISPYLMNEPFLDPQLPERLRYIRRRLPRAKLVLTTNASMLRPESVDQLLTRPVLVDALYISFQGIDAHGYELAMRGGVRFETTRRNVDYLIDRVRKLRTPRPQIWITMVKTSRVDWRKALDYWRSRGVRCKATQMDNRGGNLDEESLFPAGRFEPNTTCTRLFKQAYILVNGDMVLCCADYRREVILGNCADRSIFEIWNGEKAVRIRRAYSAGRFGELDLCKDCRVDRVRWRTAKFGAPAISGKMSAAGNGDVARESAPIEPMPAEQEQHAPQQGDYPEQEKETADYRSIRFPARNSGR